MGQIESHHIPIFHTLETLERINKHIAFHQSFEPPDKMAIEQWQRIRADLQRQLGEMLAAIDALPIIPEKSFSTTTPARHSLSAAEQMAKIREHRLAKRAAAEAALKLEAEKRSNDIAPGKRGISPEHMAKIREARLARAAAAKPIADETPKMRGQSAEHMAKMREARLAKRTDPPIAKPTADETPKKRGMSAEHMAKIREARLAKLAEAPVKPTADEAPKKRGMSAEHMAMIREARAKAAAKTKR